MLSSCELYVTLIGVWSFKLALYRVGQKVNRKLLSIATQLRCGCIFSNHFITNFPQNLPVKNLKSVNIWRRYG